MSIRIPRDQAPESPVDLDRYAAMDMAERRKIWIEISDITPEELAKHMEHEKAREAIVPQPGEMAPDFVADVLDRERLRTGETVQLAALRGKPVGLVFGSFT